MHEAWKSDPSSVHASWAAYFSALEAGLPREQAHMVPENLGYDKTSKVSLANALTSPSVGGGAGGQPDKRSILKSVQLNKLAAAYQRNGHFKAQLDPLQRERTLAPKYAAPQLDPSYHGFTEADLDQKIYVGEEPPILSLRGKQEVTLRETLEALKQAYCQTIGVEFTHLQNDDMIGFLRERFEVPPKEMSKEEKMTTLDRLSWSEMFEKFLDTKYGGAKRFGLEGCESLIPGFKALIDTAADHGISFNFFFAMFIFFFLFFL